jgi:hypothetical protein
MGEGKDEYLESEKLKIEREKVEIERERLKVERQKGLWSAAATFLPLFIAAASIGFAVYQQDVQAKSSLRQQALQAHENFRLKAAEIVMDVEDLWQADDRARVLNSLFPEMLPDDWAEHYSMERRTLPLDRLLERLAAHPEDSEKILSFYAAIYPTDPNILELRSTGAPGKQ